MTLKKGPGRSHRKGISIIELFRMFADEHAAQTWFEAQRWPDGVRQCPDCDSDHTSVSSHKTMPYRCKSCRAFFSVRKGTVMEGSNLGYREWAIAIYMATTSLKGVSSMKLHRELGITQKTAWHLMQRIRKGFTLDTGVKLPCPVEVDETYIGGLEENKHGNKKLRAGRGTMVKKAVVGPKDKATKQVRAEVVNDTIKEILQGFVDDHANPSVKKFTDENTAYSGLPSRESVAHSLSLRESSQAHANGMESFWALLKRGYHDTFHHISFKHLHRYVTEFAGHHNIRDKDTLEQMSLLAVGLIGKRLRYRDLIASVPRLRGSYVF